MATYNPYSFGGGMPAGYNPYDPIGSRSFSGAPTIAPSIPATPAIAPYMSGPMPTGYNPNDPAKWWQESGQYVTPGSAVYDPGAAASNQPIVPAETPPIPKTWQDQLQDVETANPPPPIPDIPAPTDTDMNLTPYGDLLNLPKLSYVSPNTKDYWNQARTVFQKNLTASTQPALQETLAGSREQAIRRGGTSSGLIRAGEIPIEKAYMQNIATQMGNFEQSALSAQIQEAKDAAIWENTQNKEIRDFYSTQQLDKNSWDRLQKADSEMNRIVNLYKNQQISSEEAWNQYNAAYTERNNILDRRRQDILTQLSLSEKEKDWEKKKNLDLELARITGEMNRASADAQEKAGMWGGLGTLAGGALGGWLGGLFG